MKRIVAIIAIVAFSAIILNGPAVAAASLSAPSTKLHVHKLIPKQKAKHAKVVAKAKQNVSPTIYVCQKCKMEYTVAEAKKDHFICPMDQGKLAPSASTR